MQQFNEQAWSATLCDPTKPSALSPWPHAYNTERHYMVSGGQVVAYTCVNCGKTFYTVCD